MKIKSLLLLPVASLLLSGCSLEDLIKVTNSSNSESLVDDNSKKENGSSNEEGQTQQEQEQKPSQTEDKPTDIEEKPSEEKPEEKPSEENPEEKPTEEKPEQKPEESSSYLVTFNPGLGSGTIDPIEVEDGFSVILPTCTFTAPLGYKFYRWGDKDGVTYKEKTSVTIFEDTEFTAYYIENGKNVYTVSFESNGGSGSMASVRAEEGTYKLPECEFTAPSGKVFDYWSIPNASTKYHANDPIPVNGDVTVSANWKNAVEQTFYITYVANGGSGSMSKTSGKENTWVKLSECGFTAPSGKEFDYWNVDGNKYLAGVAIQLTKNYTATAIWKNKVEEVEEEEDNYDLVNLDCGYKNVGIPDNKDNPIKLKTTLEDDYTTWYNTKFDKNGMGDYRYIDGDRVATEKTYQDTGYLKITDKGQGFGSPYFTHTGRKLEIRIGFGEVHGTGTTCNDKTKDAFRIYFFGENNNLLGEIGISAKSIKNYDYGSYICKYYAADNASQVRYFEFRCFERPFNSSGKYMNVGLNYCNIKSWERGL